MALDVTSISTASEWAAATNGRYCGPNPTFTDDQVVVTMAVGMRVINQGEETPRHQPAGQAFSRKKKQTETEQEEDDLQLAWLYPSQNMRLDNLEILFEHRRSPWP